MLLNDPLVVHNYLIIELWVLFLLLLLFFFSSLSVMCLKYEETVLKAFSYIVLISMGGGGWTLYP
jgi:hypothetical protein